jgi:hypothetical protein
MLLSDETQWAYDNQDNNRSFEQHVYRKLLPKKNASAYACEALSHNRNIRDNTEYPLYNAYFEPLALESMAILHAWVNPG